MSQWQGIGQVLVVLGIITVAAGLAITYFGRIPWLGNLPGDLHFHGRNWSVHIPLVTGLVLSIILTLILNLFTRR